MRMALLLLLAFATPAAAEERTLLVAPFDRIRVEGPVDVTVRAGTSDRVQAEGSPAALESVAARVQDGLLVIGPNLSRWGGWPNGKPERARVMVTARTLRAAALAGPGTLDVDRIAAPRVALTANGTGALQVATVEADTLQADAIGTARLTIGGGSAKRAVLATLIAGTIDAAGLQADTAAITAQSSEPVHATVQSQARVVASGGGKVTVDGGASCTVDGNAPVECAGGAAAAR